MEDCNVINDIKIDPLIFSFKFSCRCSSGECCNYGVYTDYKEYEDTLNRKEEIIGIMDESQSKNIDDWFESPEVDSDFNSGIAVGTNIVNDKCTFLDKHGLCTLQKLSLSKGMHKWAYKPLYCVLFPLVISEGILTVDDEHIERLSSCNQNPGANNTIFDSCREELQYLFGEVGFEQLEKYRKEYLGTLKAKELV